MLTARRPHRDPLAAETNTYKSRTMPLSLNTSTVAVRHAVTEEAIMAGMIPGEELFVIFLDA